MDMQYTERLIATNKTKSKPKPNFSALSPVRASDLLFRTGEHGKCTEAIFWPVWGRLETLFARGSSDGGSPQARAPMYLPITDELCHGDYIFHCLPYSS